MGNSGSTPSQGLAHATFSSPHVPAGTQDTSNTDTNYDKINSIMTDNAFDLDHYFVTFSDDGKTKVEHTKANPALLEGFSAKGRKNAVSQLQPKDFPPLKNLQSLRILYSRCFDNDICSHISRFFPNLRVL